MKVREMRSEIFNFSSRPGPILCVNLLLSINQLSALQSSLSAILVAQNANSFLSQPSMRLLLPDLYFTSLPPRRFGCALDKVDPLISTFSRNESLVMLADEPHKPSQDCGWQGEEASVSLEAPRLASCSCLVSRRYTCQQYY